MSNARTRGREYALQILYEIDTREADADTALIAYWEHFQGPGEVPEAAVRDFAGLLVRGVAERRRDLDALIERCSINWRVDRMPRVDRNVIRLATFELKESLDVPMKVVINEAIELGKRFG